MKLGDSAAVLAQMSLRSLVSHRVKSVIVGSIMFFGTALVVVGTSLLDSVERSMAESIIFSLAGHLQTYQADARDDLEIFGGMSMSEPDIGEIPDFAKVREALAGIEDVAAVVPMGIGMAGVGSDTDFDKASAELRAAAKAGDDRLVADLRERIKRLLDLMRKDLENSLPLVSDRTEIDEALGYIERAASDDFWSSFDEDAEGAMHFLDTRVAPVAGEGKLVYLRYMGTDIHYFARTFERFEVVEGEMVPEEERGILLNRKYLDRYVKLLVARLVDEIWEGVDRKGLKISKDKALAAKARQVAKQAGAVSLQLDPDEAQKLGADLAKLMPGKQGGIDDLLAAFLELDDGNIRARRDFFYERIAPLIDLYPFWVGDTITLRAGTRRGYLKSVNVKVHGVFAFKGLEGSELSGAVNLVDLRTFRDLYGQMTDAQRDELKDIKEEVGVEQVGRDSVEDALFGGGPGGGGDAGPEAPAGDGFAAGFDVGTVDAAGGEGEEEAPLTEEERNSGLVLNAAIMLKDQSRIESARATIEQAFEQHGLGLTVVDWQAASGIVGQFVVMVRIVLYVAIFIIFSVALVIINNSMVMATMERVKEIGTLRAIGAQRGFVTAMFLLETCMLGVISGALGAAAGAGIMIWLGKVGLPATADVLVFLFSGPRLYPTYGLGNLVAGMLIIVLVSLVATLYPALLATRIQPIEAMQSGEA
jgi:ABC-type lipoprotein release transport system permease subunit